MTLRIVRGFTLIVDDDVNLHLDLETLKLPTLEEITETYQPGGSDLQIDVAGLGVKALSMQMKIRSHTPEIIGIFGGPPGLRHKFTGKKHVVSEEDGREHEHSIDVTGRLVKVDSEGLTAGKATGYDCEIKNIWDYTEFWDGAVLHRFSFKRGGWLVRNGQEIGGRRRSILNL
ncbi:phage major tail tube protein [Bartonella gliris]|uniref:phage major tail tube protein n=1 Tax=Bartonella gliris TaxID=3004109 RepID=UPI0038739C14